MKCGIAEVAGRGLGRRDVLRLSDRLIFRYITLRLAWREVLSYCGMETVRPTSVSFILRYGTMDRLRLMQTRHVSYGKIISQ